MAIEFECPSCRAVLRTSAGNATALAACPACGGDLVVPEDQQPDSGPDVELDHRSNGHDDRVAYRAEFDEIVVCDLCGARNVPEDTVCRNCGEPIAALPPVVEEKPPPPPLESGPPFTVDEVVSKGWGLYREEFGPLLLGSIISWFAWIAGLIGGFIPIFLMGALFRIGVIRRPVLVMLPFLAFVWVLITTYSQIGMMIYVEHVVRERKGEVGLLFRGSGFILRVLALNTIYWTLVFAGLIAFVIPGLVLHAMFWPAPFVLVEQNCGVFEALERSRRLTHGHRGTLFLVSLVEVLVSTIGVALTIVSVATAPFLKVLLTVTYLRLTGRSVDSEEGWLDDDHPLGSVEADDVLEPTFTRRREW